MIKSRLKMLKFATLGFLVLLLVLFPVSSVFAAGLGHVFYGTVKVGDVDADIGTVISAQVDWTEYGSCTVTTAGSYALIVQGKIDDGATIHFYVDGQEAEQTFPFHDGWTTERNLTAPPVQYNLTIFSTAGGSVTTPGEGIFPDYDAGQGVSLVASPAAGYQFVNWTGAVGTVADVNDPTTTITMNGDYAIQANFEEIPPDQYELTISSTAGGSVTTPGEGTFPGYVVGTVVILVASPATGYGFVNWTGDTGDIDDVDAASTTITMNGDYEIVANFETIPVPYYPLIMAVNGSGSTSPAVGQHGYAEGTVVPIIATPGSGWQFVNWTGDVSTVADVNDPTTTITMNGDYTIQANFEAIPPVQYDLTIYSTAGGSVTAPGEGTFPGYVVGTVVSLVASPATGFQFVNWTGAIGTVAGVNDPTTTITMNGDYTIQANFGVTPVLYDLTISSTTGGSVTSPGEGTFTYDADAVVSLVASPVAGYQFVNWTGDVASPDSATTTVVMDSDKTVTANFEEISPPPGTTDVSDDVSAVGVFINSITATSEDGKCNLIIPEGTVGLTEDLEPLDEITMWIMDDPPAPPVGAHIIGLPYNFGPKGANFEPEITLVYTYTLADIPEGVAEEDLVIAYWDEEAGEAGEWIELISIVDTTAKTITATVSHFTAFAILTPAPPPATFSLSNLSIQPVEVEPNEAVMVTVSVANTGGTEGSYTVVLEINSVKQTDESITVAAGSSQEVTFGVARQHVGSYSVTVDGLKGGFTVVATISPAEPFNWPLVGGIIAALVVILIVFLVGRRRA